MRKTEIILVVAWLSFLLLGSIDYPGNEFLFVAITGILALFYLIGGYKIFKGEPTISIWVRIIAGLSLACSIVTIPWNIYLRHWEWLKILPLLNAGFTLFLIGLLIWRRVRKLDIAKVYISILARASLVLIVTCFFAFRPLSSASYRSSIIFLNAGNEGIVSNMKTAEFVEQTNKELELGNCNKAIQLSLESFKHGKKWLGIKDDSLSPEDLQQLWKIQTTYTNVYRAYKCNADGLYANGDYKDALFHQLKADSFLNVNPTAWSDWWRNERASSKNEIGLCYDKLNQYDSAISYFTLAVNYHVDTIGMYNTNLSRYLNNLSNSLSDAQYWDESTQASKASLIVLDADSISDDKKDNYAQAYLQLVHNALVNSSLDSAQMYLEHALEYVNSSKECRYLLYKSIHSYLTDYFSETVVLATRGLHCYKEQLGLNSQNVAECHRILFDAWLSIPNYDSAYANMQFGKLITESNYEISSTKYHDFLRREASYYHAIGDYRGSKKLYLDVKKIYEKSLGKDSDKLPEVLLGLALQDIELEYFGDLKLYLNESLRIGNFHDLFRNDKAYGLLNDIAYVQYSIGETSKADSTYHHIISSNIKSGNDSSLTVAVALNGLGLIEVRRSNHDSANSLFTKSIIIYQDHFPNGHPEMAVVLLNKSELELIMGDFKNGETTIDEALEVFTRFHKDAHPTIGDMLSTKAEILIEGDNLTGARSVLTDALRIYEGSYDAHSPKIKQTNEKLRALANK